MKQCMILLGCMFFLLGLCWSAVAQEDMREINDPAFQSHQRPPALFNHDQHNEKASLYDCSVCHHLYEKGKLLEGEMSVGQHCSECHGLKATDKNKVALMDAYHKQCISCHKEQKKGPITCGECHQRKPAKVAAK